MTDATPAVSPLRRRTIDDMSLRNLLPATKRSCLHAVSKFSRYFDRSPDRLGLEDVRAYLVSRGISWAALNQTVCALRFFCGVTLNRAKIPQRIAYARMPRKLPMILPTTSCAFSNRPLKARAVLTTACATGLRASEAVSLKIAPWQRRQRPHDHALASASRHLADLLAPSATMRLAISRAWRQAGRYAGAPSCAL